MDDAFVEKNLKMEKWKNELEQNFSQWLAELDEIPDQTDSLSTIPDLYSFYQEICVLRNEFRRGGRRNQEVLSQFSESLFDFQKEIVQLKNQFSKQEEEKEVSAKQSLFPSLLDLFARLERLQEKLNEKPKKSFFVSNVNLWEKQWTAFQEGFNIAFSHFQQFLKKEGLSKIATLGKAFDATLMTIIAIDENSEEQSNTVIEEISPGFFYRDKVIQLAEVKISKKEH